MLGQVLGQEPLHNASFLKAVAPISTWRWPFSCRVLGDPACRCSRQMARNATKNKQPYAKVSRPQVSAGTDYVFESGRDGNTTLAIHALNLDVEIGYYRFSAGVHSQRILRCTRVAAKKSQTKPAGKKILLNFISFSPNRAACASHPQWMCYHFTV